MKTSHDKNAKRVNVAALMMAAFMQAIWARQAALAPMRDKEAV